MAVVTVPVYHTIVCRNSLCQTVLAVTDDTVLIVAGLIMLELPTPFSCWKCGEKYVWRPKNWIGREEKKEMRRRERTLFVQPKSSAISQMIDEQERKRCSTC